MGRRVPGIKEMTESGAGKLQGNLGTGSCGGATGVGGGGCWEWDGGILVLALRWLFGSAEQCKWEAVQRH